jgi:hypothetical protein
VKVNLHEPTNSARKAIVPAARLFCRIVTAHVLGEERRGGVGVGGMGLPAYLDRGRLGAMHLPAHADPLGFENTR